MITPNLRSRLARGSLYEVLSLEERARYMHALCYAASLIRAEYMKDKNKHTFDQANVLSELHELLDPSDTWLKEASEASIDHPGTLPGQFLRDGEETYR